MEELRLRSRILAETYKVLFAGLTTMLQWLTSQPRNS